MKPFTFAVANSTYLGWCFFLLFAAYSPAESFLTRLYPRVGFWALGIVYFSFGLFSNISAPIIQRFGPRAAMVAGAIPYLLFVLANLFYWEWLIYLASFATGFGAALLWPAQGYYLARLGYYSLHPLQSSTPSTTALPEQSVSIPPSPSPTTTPSPPALTASQPSPTAATPLARKGAPPARRATNMGLLTGITYFLNNFASIVVFLVTSFVVLTPGTLFLVLTVLNAVAIVFFCFLRHVPAVPDRPKPAGSSGSRGEAEAEVPPDRSPIHMEQQPSSSWAAVKRWLRRCFGPLGRLMLDPNMILFQVCFIFYGSFYSYFTGAVLPLVQTPGYVSPLLICRGLTKMACSVLLGKAGDRWGHARVFFCTYFLAALSLALVLAVAAAGPTAEWLFFVAFLVYGCVEGSQPVLTLALLEHYWTGRPEAFALFCVVRSFVCGVFFFCGGRMGAGPLGLVVSGLGVCAVAAFLAMWGRFRRAAMLAGEEGSSLVSRQEP
ncbi:hypothetical protein PAPYR_657 [Paratrimastix pyriformis]|uniref:UNC93-like protein MFSD11 n=1 Tax=Paratrimastix pyriformis TaxID=342808 RepID=A0ABQ8UU44_9EUKA|nr:hypothetical protein PAPYR_657 [Paratrimastix pyriformis]